MQICDNGFGNPVKPLSTLRGVARRRWRGLLGPRWRRRLRTTVTAGTAMTTAGPTRTHARSPRAAPRRTTGTATRRERPPGEHPPRRTLGTSRPDRPLGTEHAVVVVAIRLSVVGELDAGEEDDRQHEQNACHDHHPRRGPIEAGVLGHGR